ncbi:hypothetical protein Ahy_B08g093609 [Arachis hypogaea]|uniref:Rhodanese domain-containing protein n=1 Tax=Arachis hypogaea TaxID=3818 RepID=A0A444Y6H7_ARAHY|nr:hypothetical protein Ahy_B08g093609 [Arachis hypogaea]
MIFFLLFSMVALAAVKTIGYFKVKVYHGGWFTYKNGPLEYVGGETTVIEEIDGDRWSVFEAYAELKQLGYVEENIPSLWFKDPVVDDMEKNLKLFKTDADSIEMCRIAELRDHVELYVVHKVQDEEMFSDDGYIDVGDKDGMGDISEGQELVLYGGVDEGRKQSEPFAAYSRAEDDNEVEYDNSSDSDSLDSKYNPSGEEDDSEDDVHFTDSDDELDPEVSGFQHENVMSKKPRAVKKNAGATEQFENDEGGDSDDLDFDQQVGADGSDLEHEGFRFPVHKLQKDMSQYKWEVGTLYASWEEFKDTVTAYVVHTARSIRFRKCDLQKVRAICSGDCPFGCMLQKSEMSGIPCVHAISCIKFKGLDLESFVAGCYKKEAYMRCYDSIIHPLNGLDLWKRTAHSDVMPPPVEGLVTGQ